MDKKKKSYPTFYPMQLVYLSQHPWVTERGARPNATRARRKTVYSIEKTRRNWIERNRRGGGAKKRGGEKKKYKKSITWYSKGNLILGIALSGIKARGQ